MNPENGTGMEPMGSPSEAIDKAVTRFEELKTRVFDDEGLKHLSDLEMSISSKASIVEDLSRQPNQNESVQRNTEEVRAEISTLQQELTSDEKYDEYTTLRKEMRQIQADVEFLRK